MYQKFLNKTKLLKRLTAVSLALIMAFGMPFMSAAQLVFADKVTSDVISEYEEADSIDDDFEVTENDTETEENDIDDTGEDVIDIGDGAEANPEADITPRDGAVKSVNTTSGINVSLMSKGDSWSGANIILGDDASEWPFSNGGDVALTPEKDAVYSLSFNATATGGVVRGFRVRWIKGNGNDYTAGDTAIVNNHKYSADDVATIIPAYFENTIVQGETKTYNVDFKMDGNEAKDGLIGNIAIRGQAGANDFDINWVSIKDADGELLAYWDSESGETDPDGAVAGLTWDKYPALHEVYEDYFLLGLMDSPADSMAENKRNLINYHFNALTPGNAMKPESVQSVKGIFTFELMDQIFKNLDGHVQKIGHTLGWHSQTPDWMWGGTPSAISEEEAIKNIKDHVEAVLMKYGKDLQAMDVVNEAIGDNAKGINWKEDLREAGWYSSPLKERWVEEFFKAAADVVDAKGWDCKLYYNDFNLDNSAKARSVYNMVKDINEKYTDYRSNGKPLIEGIGMQAHYSWQTSPSNVEDSIKLFGSIPDITLSITELDIGYTTTDGVLSDDQAVSQGKKYAELFQIFMKYAVGSANTGSDKWIERVTICGTQDRIDGGWRSGTAPTLFDLDMLGKESLVAVLDPVTYLENIISGPQTEWPKATTVFGSPKLGENDSLWNKAQSLEAKVQPVKEPSGMGDEPAATAVVKTMWDNKYLYVRAEVIDDNVTKNSDQAHEQDSVEIFVSEKNSKGAYISGDNQYRVGFDGRKSIKSGSTGEFDASAQTTSKGYLVELKIPFKEITPKNGTEIGFDIQINDVDGASRKLTVWSDLEANGYNSTLNFGSLKLVKLTEGVSIYSRPDGNAFTGINIMLGNDKSVWPWTEATNEGTVAFVPEKDETYRFSFNVTSTGIAGFRVRWVQADDYGSHPIGDTNTVNDNVYTADQVATKVPAYFNNTISNGETKTYVVEFTMDGNQPATGPIGSLAVRGAGGGSDFIINWLTVETMDGETLVEWESGDTDDTDEEFEEQLLLNIQFDDDDKELYEDKFSASGSNAEIEWVKENGIGHGDNYVLKGTHVDGAYTSADNAVRFMLPDDLQLQRGGIYNVSFWVYVPSALNSGKSTLTGPGIVLNEDYGGATGVYKFPASPGTIEMDEWKQVSITIPWAEIDPISSIDFRFVVNDEPKHPDAWYIDDISISLVGDQELPELKWDLSLASLKETYKNYFLFGNVLEPRNLNNSDLLEMYKHHYNAVTAENAMKPVSISSAKGVYNFTEADKVVNWALDNKIPVHGHTLVWHSQSPAWVNPSGTTREEAQANLKEFIETVAGHYKGKVISWDVANEIFVDGGSGDWKNQIRQDAANGLWYRAYANGADASKGESGVDYIYDAFVITRLVDPNAVLYYNDYNDDSVTKSTAIAAMVKELNEKWKNDSRNTEPDRLLIEGVGMQSHYGSSTSVANVEASIKRFIDAGVRISVSELDATRYNNQSELSQAEQEEQAKFFAQLFEVYIKYAEHIDRVTIWGLEDKSSWRSTGHPTLFDTNYTAKEAYKAVIDPYGYLGKEAPEEDEPTASVTYTATANGSVNVNSSNKITLKFSEAITGLTVANINFDAKNTGTAMGELKRISGTVYELWLAKAVATAGNVQISIDKLDIEAVAKTVKVHKYVQSTGSNNDNNSGGSSSSDSGSSSSDSSSSSSSNGSGGTSSTATTPPNKIISSTDSSKTIRDAVDNNKTPEIVISGNYKGVEFNGRDLLAGNNVVIKNGIVKVNLTPDVVKDLGVKAASKVELILTPNTDTINKAMSDKLISFDKINKELNGKIVDLGIKIDRNSISSTTIPVKVTIDVSGLYLSSAQRSKFTGVYFDDNLKSYVKLGGEFSSDGNTFSFYTYNEGKIGFIVADKLDRLKLTIGNKSIVVNGRVVDNDVAPIILENRTLVPLRVIAENLGADVDWNPDTFTVSIVKDGKKVSLKIGEQLPSGMGTSQIMDNRTYVPIRYIMEQLGANVVWDDTARTVSIYQ